MTAMHVLNPLEIYWLELSHSESLRHSKGVAREKFHGAWPVPCVSRGDSFTRHGFVVRNLVYPFVG